MTPSERHETTTIRRVREYACITHDKYSPQESDAIFEHVSQYDVIEIDLTRAGKIPQCAHICTYDGKLRMTLKSSRFRIVNVK